MARFSIDDIRSLMSAVSITYNKATRKQAKEYWNDLANRLNELAKEMEEVKKEAEGGGLSEDQTDSRRS